MCAEKNKHEKIKMSLGRFLKQINSGYAEGETYCFIIGAGASKKSGIPTGLELIAQWREELLAYDERTLRETMDSLEIDQARYSVLFGEDYTVKSGDYFDFFDMRFEGVPPYQSLQKLMANAKASFGYYALAVLLKETQNKIVITTNFDTLTEDTLFLYCAEHPLVVGHESLASYIEATENRARPIVAKVHRDLMLKPLNRKSELQKLKDNWKNPLTSVLSRSIPIVVGYGGGDQTLMGLLSEIDLKGIYWCHYGGDLDEKVMALLTKSETTGRHLVELEKAGFDTVMYRLVKTLLPDFDFADISERITRAATERAEIFSSQLNKYAEKAQGEKNAAKPEQPRKEADSGQAAEHHRNEGSGAPQKLQEMSVAMLKLMDADAFNAGEYEKSLEICNELLLRQPDNAEYLNSRGVTLHEMGRYAEALADKTRAVELESEAARFRASRGVTLHEMGRYEEAFEDETAAIGRRPENARYWHLRDVTLHEMGRYAEALHDCNKAVELEPENAKYLNSRGETLYAMRRYAEALQDIDAALKLDSGNKVYQAHRAQILKKMGK